MNEIGGARRGWCYRDPALEPAPGFFIGHTKVVQSLLEPFPKGPMRPREPRETPRKPLEM